MGSQDNIDTLVFTACVNVFEGLVQRIINYLYPHKISAFCVVDPRRIKDDTIARISLSLIAKFENLIKIFQGLRGG